MRPDGFETLRAALVTGKSVREGPNTRARQRCIRLPGKTSSKRSVPLPSTAPELRERLDRRRRLLAQFAGDESLRRVLQEDIADIERELERRFSQKGERLVSR
jgi:hypothetical protein